MNAYINKAIFCKLLYYFTWRHRNYVNRKYPHTDLLSLPLASGLPLVSGFPLVSGLSITPVAFHGRVQLLHGCGGASSATALAPPSLPTRFPIAPLAGVIPALCTLKKKKEEDIIS